MQGEKKKEQHLCRWLEAAEAKLGVDCRNSTISKTESSSVMQEQPWGDGGSEEQ